MLGQRLRRWANIEPTLGHAIRDISGNVSADVWPECTMLTEAVQVGDER